MIVVTAARGGMFRETIAMSKAYAESRARRGESALLDEIVSAKPEMDHTRYHSAAEVRDSGLQHLRDAVALLENKATAEELDGYRRFVLTLANKVAAAHREDGQSVSPAETAVPSRSQRRSARPAMAHNRLEPDPRRSLRTGI